MNPIIEAPSLRRVAASPLESPARAAQTPVLADAERQRCEVWTRVMGYHRPVSSFNIGKQGEHAERRFFQTPPCNRR
jgi:hypothetical protein